MRGVVVSLGLVALLALAAGAPPARAQAPAGVFEWSQPQRTNLPITRFTCPAAELCIAATTGHNAGLAVSTNPADPQAWRRIPGPRDVKFITCPSVQLCAVAAGSTPGRIFVSRHPADARSYRVVFKGSNVWDLSCPAVDFCASVVTERGMHLLISAHPSAKRSWRARPTQGYDIQCASAHLCLTVGNSGSSRNAAWVLHDPLARRSKWQRVRLTPNPFDDSSYRPACTAPFACLYGTWNGTIYASGTGTPTPPWTRSELVPRDHQPNTLVWPFCMSEQLCFARITGRLFESTHPFAAAPLWTQLTLPLSDSQRVEWVSCPTPALCMVSAHQGNASYLLTGRAATPAP